MANADRSLGAGASPKLRQDPAGCIGTSSASEISAIASPGLGNA